MNNTPTWPKVFAFTGLAVVSFALALYSTSVATAGVAAGILGDGVGGADLLSWGSALLLVGIAAAAAFAYLALRSMRTLQRRRG